MDPRKLRKKQIARRLGVSEQVLEQYLQLKNAEVLQPKAPARSPTISTGTSASTSSTPTMATGKKSTDTYGSAKTAKRG